MRKFLLSTAVILIILMVATHSLNELTKSRNFQLLGEIMAKGETTEKVVALTFDDGPAENTEEILEILRSENTKATFFLTGYEMEMNMEATKKIVQEGHEIGNHSYSHKRMIFKSPAFIKDEIERTDELIRQAGYQGDIHFRPPNARKLLFLPHYLQSQGRKTIMWSMEPDSFPEIARDAGKIVEHVLENVEPGSIILLHVMYENREQSLRSVKGIIEGLKQQGYTFVTVSELLEY